MNTVPHDKIQTSKENSKPEPLQFLLAGGEMGELIRSFDWSNTAIGSPDTWPQSLRIAVRIMLDCPFGMYIAWGNEYIQLYNDGYRPILGATKHPQALGISTRKTFEEIWTTIGPMFEGVMEGTPVGFPDFILHLDRNGFVEECVFDFSYSPIRLDDGKVGGVLVTVIETTEKVKAVKALKESLTDVSLAKLAIQKSEENLKSTILQAPVAMCIFKGENFIVELANDRMFEFWGKPAKEVMHKPIFEGLPEAKDQGFEAILKGVYTSGKTFFADGVPVTLPRNGVIEMVYVNLVYEPYREADGIISGILAVAIDVTAQITASKKIEASEQNLKRYKHMADNATEPFILMQQDGKFAYLNDLALERWGYTKEEAEHIRVPDVDPIYNDEVFKAAFEAAQKEKIPQFETLHKKKDGTVYPVEINMGGLTLEGKPHLFAIARDITERKKLEAAVLESEKKIRSFILQAPVAMCLYRGPQYIIEIVNDELLAIWDKSFDSVINKPVFDALPEAKDQGFEDLLHKVYTTGEKYAAFGIPITLPRNGKAETIYVNLVYQAYHETDGSISGIVEVVSDVTEQVVATQQTEASEQRFGAAVEAVQGILWTNNANGEMEGEQKGWAALTGQSYEEYQGYGWATAVHPDDAQPTIEAWNEAVKELKTFVFEHRLKTKSGEWELFSIKAIPLLNKDGSLREWIGVHTNITEQKDAEEKIKSSESQFRTFADSIQNLAWIADAEGWTYWYNQRWYDYTGTTLEEMKGWGWEKVHHPDHIKNVIEFIKEAWKKDAAFELTFPLRRNDGEYRWFLTRGYPVKDANGNIERWIGTNTDIHEQKIINEKKDEFISIASHEMKTPLTTAKGYVELLLLSLKEENQTALYATKANQAIDRLNLLITELLDASKIQNGQLNYTITKFDFNKLMDETIENIQYSAKKHSIEKVGNCLKQVSGDRDRLQQVLINLLNNAIKYSPNANKVVVKIEEQDGSMQVSVQDFGVGMSRQHIDKIFDKYYRVQEHAIHFQGLGIGLYISNNIVERHEGKMWAESEPGKGSTVYFNLPL